MNEQEYAAQLRAYEQQMPINLPRTQVQQIHDFLSSLTFFYGQRFMDGSIRRQDLDALIKSLEEKLGLM